MPNLPLQPLSIFTLICLFFSSTIVPVFAQVAYTYDQNGNMTSDGTNCYTYNDANQLIQVANCNTSQVIAQYVYNYQGDRKVKKIYSSGTLQKTVYSPNDGYETIKMASNGATLNTTYYQVNDVNVAKKNPDGSMNYFLTDNLGSTTTVTNQSGTVMETTKYYPYGQIRSGGTKSKYLFTGQENDAETGLDYYNSRYYNASLQRFIQPDTVIANIYNPQSLNRYSYVGNNPLTYNDPTGHVNEILAYNNALNQYYNNPSKQNYNNVFKTAQYIQKQNYQKDTGGVKDTNKPIANFINKYTHLGDAMITLSNPKSTASQTGLATVSILSIEDAPEIDLLKGAKKLKDASKMYDTEQQIIIQWAKQYKQTGISNDDADALLQMAKENGIVPVLDHRIPEEASHWDPYGTGVGIPHIRIGQQNHIEVNQ